MVYIQNGRVLEDRPWSWRRIPEFFWGIVTFVIFFFKTLFGFDTSSANGSRGGSRGGGGPDYPSGRGPRGPRTIGRITTIQDCSMPGGG